MCHQRKDCDNVTISLKPTEKKCSFMDASCLQGPFREHHSDEQFPQGPTPDCNPVVLVSICERAQYLTKVTQGVGRRLILFIFRNVRKRHLLKQSSSPQGRPKCRGRITADFLLPHTPSWAPAYGMILRAQGKSSLVILRKLDWDTPQSTSSFYCMILNL